MQKYFIILIIYMLCAVGCTKSWTKEEENDFINDCVTMNGIETTCICVANCLEIEFISYNNALTNIEKKELSNAYKLCVEKCK